MRIILVTALLTLVAATPAAQVVGYGVAGPATTMGFVDHSRISFNVAGGADVFFARHIAIGGEGGFFNRLSTASANASLHAGDGRSRVRPFVTAGYSRLGLGDGDGAFSGFNAGGGVNAWIGDRAGVRFELRDHVRPDDRGLTHYWAARLGIVFK